MEELRKKDYSQLEGKIIRYFNGSTDYRAKVILVDPDIGITIVNADDENHYLSCLIMPRSPKWQEKWNEELDEAKKDFLKFIKYIEEGEWIIKEEDVSWDQQLFGSVVKAENCPFL